MQIFRMGERDIIMPLIEDDNAFLFNIYMIV
jgi:hypothetical protein